MELAREVLQPTCSCQAPQWRACQLQAPSQLATPWCPVPCLRLARACFQAEGYLGSLGQETRAGCPGFSGIMVFMGITLVTAVAPWRAE